MAKPTRSKPRAPAKSAARKASGPRKATSRKPAKAKSAKGAVAKARTPALRGKTAATRKVGRRARPAAAARPARAPQRVAVSHYNNDDFESGLRSYAQYRDLGIVDATDGMVRAHVLRFTERCDPEVVSRLHFHDTEFQMVYVLKGWVKTELEGQGEITMRQGSAWTQPPQLRHRINDYSEDAELLEIILPADFATEEIVD